VTHLKKLNRQRRPSASPADQFRDGFASCVAEVGRFVTASPEAHFAPRLMAFLGQRLHSFEQTLPITVNVAAAASQCVTPASQCVASDCGYVSDRDSVSPANSVSPVPVTFTKVCSQVVVPAVAAPSVWRPF
jgi:hypothetical protein